MALQLFGHRDITLRLERPCKSKPHMTLGGLINNAAHRGYCIYNNIAVAARYAISKGIKRVLIVDWDLHHGNGIQNIFLNDDKVMYFSVHYHGRGDYYPGESGALHVVGNDDGYGTIMIAAM